jgi:hypothetical protein
MPPKKGSHEHHPLKNLKDVITIVKPQVNRSINISRSYFITYVDPR